MLGKNSYNGERKQPQRCQLQTGEQSAAKTTPAENVSKIFDDKRPHCFKTLQLMRNDFPLASACCPNQ
jgi:hypothetical protein